MAECNQATATVIQQIISSFCYSIQLKRSRLRYRCQELYPGHTFSKNNPKCAYVHTSKESVAIERSRVAACRLLLTTPGKQGRGWGVG